MAELKTKLTKASVSAYLNAITDPKRRKECKEIASLMQSVTGDKPAMWGPSIVGFGTAQYVYASGREGTWLKMGFSNRKGPMSLYLTCNLNDLAPYLEKLGTYKRGVGCLYIKTLDDIDRNAFQKLVVAAFKLIRNNKILTKNSPK